MNPVFLNIIQNLVTEQGESILSEPRRVSAFFADLAQDVPKPQKNAFVKCLEHGFAQVLKNSDEQDRNNVKQRLTQKLNDEEGLDIKLCGETLDLLEKALFGEAKKRTFCKKCSKELQEEWKTCPYCSTPVEPAINQVDFKTPLEALLNSFQQKYIPGGTVHDRKTDDQKISGFSKAIQVNPSDADAYYNRGIIYSGKGQFDKAIEDFSQVIWLNPNDAEAYYNRGFVYSGKGQYDQAIEDYNKAIKLGMYDADVYHNRGFAYDRKGDYNRAMGDYDRAINLYHYNAIVYYDRGFLYDRLGKYRRAIEDYTQAIRFDLNYKEAYNNRGVAYTRKGDYVRAIEDFYVAIRIDPNYAEARQNLANAQQQRGN